MQSTATQQMDQYRRQLDACAESLARAQLAGATTYLGHRCTAENLKMFTDGNMDKRFLKLSDELELSSDTLDELDDLIAEYVKAVPMVAYDTGPIDAERFLRWLPGHRALSDEQRDVVNCQRCRHRVEFLARRNRLQHVRFQELLSADTSTLDRRNTRQRIWIHRNPISVVSRWRTTKLLGQAPDVKLPATVVFYPVGDDIRTALLEDDGCLIFATLRATTRLSLQSLLKEIGGDPKFIMESLWDLNEVALLAFG